MAKFWITWLFFAVFAYALIAGVIAPVNYAAIRDMVQYGDLLKAH